MIGLLFIEVSAFHTFAWAEAVVSDPDLVAEEQVGLASGLVGLMQTLGNVVGYGLVVLCASALVRQPALAIGALFDAGVGLCFAVPVALLIGLWPRGVDLEEADGSQDIGQSEPTRTDENTSP